ncbi:hypothetical protein LWE61_00435 [Sphingobium sufflavum]|uniref:hypothetical protein n=1 Tax=Sphingobium sufflavum TaxID=1129547 RepID=UPI001F3870D8|nr:hypothetical protein [Sphingobium sufflavum]MCE7795015.1 hypothetical protein [Sphingobium sufflavum]
MVANLTRYSACKVHPDTPDRPVRERRAAQAAPSAGQGSSGAQRTDPTGDEPVRLFAWVSA